MGSCFWVSCCRSGKDVFSLLVAVDGQGRMPLTLFACGCAVYATSAAIKQLGGAWSVYGIGFISVFPQHLLDVGAWSAFELSAQGEFAALVSVGSAQPHHNVWDKETSSSLSFRLVEIMCLPQCLLAGERWRECSRSCLLIRSSSGLMSELRNKWTSVQTSIQAITTPRVCCVHCQPNPEKEDLGFASGELQPVIEKNLKKKLLWPSERSFRFFHDKICVYAQTHPYTHIYCWFSWLYAWSWQQYCK